MPTLGVEIQYVRDGGFYAVFEYDTLRCTRDRARHAICGPPVSRGPAARRGAVPRGSAERTRVSRAIDATRARVERRRGPAPRRVRSLRPSARARS